MANPVRRATAKVATVHQCNKRTVRPNRKIASESLGTDPGRFRCCPLSIKRVEGESFMLNTPSDLRSLYVEYGGNPAKTKRRRSQFRLRRSARTDELIWLQIGWCPGFRDLDALMV